MKPPSSESRFRPPKLAQRLVELLLPSEQAEFLLGDMEEEAERLSLEAGTAAAWRWYWRQALQSSAALRFRPRIPHEQIRYSIQGEAMTDIRYTLRGLRRQVGFASATVLLLTLGIGVNAALFSLTDAVLLRPLPYDAPDRLVQVSSANQEGFALPFMTTPGALRWQEEAVEFEGIGLYEDKNVVWTDASPANSLHVLGVSHTLFGLLGIPPRLGRAIGSEDAVPGAEPVVLLSHSFWSASFGSDPRAVGRVIRLDDLAYTVIGVMPAGFRFPYLGRADVWMPLQAGAWPGGEVVERLSVVARIPQGKTLEQMQERADALARLINEAGLGLRGWDRAQLRLLGHNRANPDIRQALWALWGASGLILVIAVFNSANLLLVRGLSRGRELAIRRAVGASRARLMRLLVTECLLLAQVAGLAAAALASVSTEAMMRVVPSEFSFFGGDSIDFDLRSLLYVFLVVQVIGLVMGSLTAVRFSSRDGQELHLRQGAASGRPGKARLALTVSQVALTLALLVGAGLLMRSFLRLVDVDPGFNPRGLAYLTIGLSEKNYPDAAQRWHFFQRVLQEAVALPGVEAATLAGGLPPESGFSFGIALQAEGGEAAPEGQPMLLPRTRIDGSFLKVFQIPVVAGAGFAANEDPNLNRVLIDQDLARFLWGSGDPVGRRFRTAENRPWLTVAGVIRDLKLMGQDDRRGSFEILHPYRTGSSDLYDSIALRTSGASGELLAALRRIVNRLDPRQPIWRLRLAGEAISETQAKPRFFFLLMGFFAALALLLSGLGVYGVLSYGVSRRRREMGIRIALGAQPSRVRSLVLKQGMGLALMGTVLGTALAAGLSLFLESLLFQVETWDPVSILASAAVLLCAVALAGFLPAQRATRVDPIRVLGAD